MANMNCNSDDLVEGHGIITVRNSPKMVMLTDSELAVLCDNGLIERVKVKVTIRT